MATINAKYSTSVSFFDFSTLLLAEDHTEKSSQYVADYVDYKEIFTGTNLSYSWLGVPKGGTITGYERVSDDDGAVVTITGLSVSASELGEAAKSLTDLSDDKALTKKIFAGADVINGSRYADELNGYAGHDVITGGRGRDILTGGAGSDTFVFAKGSGVDVITDFNASDHSSSHDLIDLSGYTSVNSFSDLDVHRSGSSVILDLAGSDRIILHDEKAAAINASDFIF
ncbi:Ca2+-binding RTX toxin-like protein [Rhizobium sp. SG_E_25_P2]|uniref:hypothetical protein n=1 Tax=Rhizobium sp. SG_E_25_P2 TaxID=2879942 RepID=UPI00247701A6|nr:hypothetical protein [Rhizobium sp. SG_E_25_P2]MDH6268142.1 Ca2+-binding RTX toxin-like protein [Rhizobium sp. SG_E_25_P2]